MVTHYFDTRTTLITTLFLISLPRKNQFKVAENVIDQDHGLGSNHKPPDLQADKLIAP